MTPCHMKTKTNLLHAGVVSEMLCDVAVKIHLEFEALSANEAHEYHTGVHL